MLDKKNFYINGQWVSPIEPRNYKVIDPSKEEPCAEISLGGKKDVDKAVSAAKKAFESWAFTTKEERLELLEKLYVIYKKRWAEMAKLISLEMGAPIKFSTEMQAATGAGHIKSFKQILKDFKFEKDLGEEKNNQKLLYEPKGVCALITPWNWPINQVNLKVIPALASACTVVLKPSEIAPLSSMLLAEMIDEARFPSGVFNLLNGDGAITGNALTSHPDINMISFTGSTRAGALISQNAAKDFKRISLELGGKGANIIFKDADPEAIARGVLRCFRNSGQSCNAPTRMLVEKSIYDKTVEKVKELANSTKVDAPQKEGDHIGPVVSEVQFNKIQTLIQKGIDEGAKLVAGGTGLVGIELKKCGYSNIEGVDFSQDMLDLIPKGIYKKIEKVDLNKPLKFETNKYDVIMCVGTFTYGHVKPQALDELIRITKNKGLICFTINEGIYEKYGFDNKIKELSDNQSWNVKEFFKSNYIVNKDVNAWLCLSEITK